MHQTEHNLQHPQRREGQILISFVKLNMSLQLPGPAGKGEELQEGGRVPEVGYAAGGRKGRRVFSAPGGKPLGAGWRICFCFTYILCMKNKTA